MLKELEDYRRGFIVGEGFKTVEWLFSKENSTREKLVFQAYDANLCPLPDMSKWLKKYYIEKQIKKGLQVTEGFKGEVWLDDVQIR